MIAHSVSKRSTKALPQVESTVSLSISAKLMRFVARQDFVVGNCKVKAGETAFAIASTRRPGRFYIVKFDTCRNTYVCSCGAGACHHEHVSTVRQFVMDKVVIPAASESSPTPMSVPATVQEVKDRRAAKVEQEQFDGSRQITAAEWREIMKRDRARQRKWQAEYRQAAEALQEEVAG